MNKNLLRASLSAPIVTLLLSFCMVLPLEAQDSLQNVSLNGVAIVYKRQTTPIKGDIQHLQWETKTLKALPKIMGNANPLHLVQFLPGIQTSSEYDSGLHIQGCESGHSQISVAGVPVYNPSHLFGLFSTFNSTHFSTLSIEQQASAHSGNYLGGELQMQLISQPVKKFAGEISVGPMSSQGTLRLPLGKRSSLVVSARGSYLNLLYGSWMKMDDAKMKYQFGDYNLTYFFHPTPKDQLWVDAYFGMDKGKVTDIEAGTCFHADWSNYYGALHWKHRFRQTSLTQSLYTTNYQNKLKFNLTDQIYHLPSAIYDYGYKAKWEGEQLHLGLQAVVHRITPQTPQLPPEKVSAPQPIAHQTSQEYSLFAEYLQPLGTRWNLNSGLKGNAYIDTDHRAHLDLSPSVHLQFRPSPAQQWQFNYQWQQQYIYKTGFSNMGLPTEFWYSCNRDISPQRAHSLSLSYDLSLFGGDWKLSASVYFKRLQHQMEYVGTIFDLMNQDYNLKNQLACGKGVNYGLNLLLNKCTGKWSGWISYSIGRAMRDFDHPLLSGRYPSNHERIHEFNLLATYRPSKKWELSATGVAASGTPFTAPDYIYWCNGHIVSHFGKHNGNRLNPYVRLDLSANYAFKKTKTKEQGINFSLYNATCIRNDIFYRMKFRKGQFYYRPLRFVAKILPSINYYCKF